MVAFQDAFKNPAASGFVGELEANFQVKAALAGQRLVQSIEMVCGGHDYELRYFPVARD